ncbi:MAG: metallophosphoesterase [candidate division WOR-3 bacterium]
MKILAISDIHGRINYDKKIIDVLSSADLVVISGDITNFGGKKEASIVLNTIKEINANVVAVPGNCDQYEVLDFLKDEGINLHGEIREFKGLLFFGIGGSGYTPFRTPQEYSDEEIERILSNYRRQDGKQIFVSHAPPFNTKVDKTLTGMHVGSKHIREFIEKNQPDLCICGHIHEARNTDRIGRTIIANPGPFPKFYGMMDITDEIKVELYNA